MKKHLKCLGFLLLTIVLSTNVNGQEDKDHYVARDRAFHATDQNVVTGEHGVGWVRSHFFDEWFFQLQGGGQLYYGTDDREGPLGDRLTGNAEFFFGRRIFPMFGFRAGLGTGYAHGFLTKDHYATHVISTGGDGICGNNAATGTPWGGYYWDYNNDLLMQKWKYFYFGADLWLNLAIFRGSDNYQEFKPWNHIMYGGVYTKYALSETDNKNHRSEAHLGYICKYNFRNNLSIYTDVRYSFIERLFDREHIHGMESAGFGVDGIFNFQVGVMYKFHTRTEDERAVYVKNAKTEVQQEVKTLTVHVRKMDTVFSMKEFDSTVVYNQVNIETPEMSNLKDSLLAIIKARQDSRKNNFEQDLMDIFLNQLLPYEMVFFKKDKWDILPEEEMKIEKMARIMKAYPDYVFILTGSADSKTGTEKRNDFLSHRRADVVYDQLVYKYGIDPKQLRREYLGGILNYTPYELNRATVIIMDHPTVQKAFNDMKARGQAGGGSVEVD